MSQIERGLWIGDVKNAGNLEWLNERNIKTVVNCGGELARPAWLTTSKPTISYHEIQAEDSLTYDLLRQHYLYFHDVMEVAEKKGHSILVNCYAGINRSATLLLAYMLHRFARVNIFPSKNAIVSHYRKFRPIILQNPEFSRQLDVWCDAIYLIYSKH